MYAIRSYYGHNDVPKCGYQDTLHAIPTFDKGTYYWKDVAGLIIKETVGFTGMDRNNFV